MKHGMKHRMKHGMKHRRHERGRAAIWILLALLAGLAAVAGLLLLLMSRDGGDEEGAGAKARPEHLEPEPEPPPPGQPPTTRLPATGQSLHRAAARHYTLVKQLKRGADASAEPWEHDRGDGPKRPVTVTVRPARKQLHPDVLLAARKLQPKISACYRDRLRAKPGLKGKVFVSFNLEAKEYAGVVSKSHIAASKVKDFKMESCVLRALATMKLPAPLAEGGKWYHLSFDLYPSLRPSTAKEEPKPPPGAPPPPPGQPQIPPGERLPPEPPHEPPQQKAPPGKPQIPPGEQPPEEPAAPRE